MPRHCLGALAVQIPPFVPAARASPFFTAHMRMRAVALLLLGFQQSDEDIIALDHAITVGEAELQRRVVGLVLAEQLREAITGGLGLLQGQAQHAVLTFQVFHVTCDLFHLELQLLVALLHKVGIRAGGGDLNGGRHSG